MTPPEPGTGHGGETGTGPSTGHGGGTGTGPSTGNGGGTKHPSGDASADRVTAKASDGKTS